MKKKNMRSKILKKYGLFLAIALTILGLHFSGKMFATQAIHTFTSYLKQMILFLPLIFIFIGLIDVWIPKKFVEKHIGNDSGFLGTVWVVLLAMIQAGPLYAAFPIAYTLWKKGCRTKNLFMYLGAFSTLKFPMLSFEIGFLGIRFTILRTIFTLPIFYIIAVFMDHILKNSNFKMKNPDQYSTAANT